MGSRKSMGGLPLLLAVMLLAGACGAAPRKDSAGTMGTNGEVEHILLRNVYLVASGEGGYRRGDDGLVRLWLFNTSTVEDTLVGVRSSRAESARIGWDRDCDGTYETVPELPIRPDGTVPYGRPYAVELVDFTGEVLGGTTVPVTFTFRHAGEKRLDAMVEVVEDGDVTDPTCATTSRPTVT
jgi:copper(I)-binding protein